MTTPQGSPPSAPTPSGGGMPKWLIILLVVLLVVIMGCCGGVGTCMYFARRAAQSAASKLAEIAKEAQAEAAKKQAEREKEAPQQGNSESPSGTTSTPTLGTEMPSNFPKDIPVYTGLTPVMSAADLTKNGGMVSLTGSGDVKTIGDYYQKQMTGGGWKEESNMNLGGGIMQHYTKDERQATITISPGDQNKPIVQIIYTKK